MKKNDLVKALLRPHAVRNAVVFSMREDYFADLAVHVPLSHGLSCPVSQLGHVLSFSEIFVQNGYEPVRPHWPKWPRRWVDLGCHAGYFSLWLEWQRQQAGEGAPGQALLVDANSTSTLAVAKVAQANHLEKQWTFFRGLIDARSGEQAFFERPFMASSAQPDFAGQKAVRIPTLTANEIIRLFPGPYDLIKIDVEGAEWDFLAQYASVYSQTRWLLIEWHVFPGRPDENEFARRLVAAGFGPPAVITPAHESATASGTVRAGVWLCERA
jgi:FkbM family methyltransferase